MSYLILITEEIKPVLVEVPQKPEPTPISDNKEFEHKFRRNVDGLYDASLLAYYKLLESAISDKSKHIQFRDEPYVLNLLQRMESNTPEHKVLVVHPSSNFLKRNVGQTFPLPTGYKVSFEELSVGDVGNERRFEKFAILSKLEEPYVVAKLEIPAEAVSKLESVVAPSEEVKLTYIVFKKSVMNMYEIEEHAMKLADELNKKNVNPDENYVVEKVKF